MYAYAFNNPIVYSDYSGQWPKISTVFAVVAVVAVAVAVVALSVATCGTATVALAGTAAVATTASSVASATIGIATTAIQVSMIATAASIATNAVENKIEDITNNNVSQGETVYKLVDDEGTVQYVGRTKNEAAREAAHKSNPHREHLRFETIERGLSKEAARGLEQYYMAVYHTINTANRANNQINGVSPKNSKLKIYIEAASKYVENKITNEVLYWTGN